MLENSGWQAYNRFQGKKEMVRNPFLNKVYRYNRPKKRDNPEGRLALEIIHYLRAAGATVGKTKTMGVQRNGHYCRDPYLFLGFPDITFFYRDKLYFCEVKSPQGKQSEHQKDFQALCIKANIPYILAHSVDDVISAVK